ncbi:hypothetical protein [Psychrobacillus sp. NPDC093180]|uniref:hypothetical protein n=1 Tax=Psychrobacillus sp. NPDC093180 TaxID=3364489 RepID=UPI0038138274
MVTQPQPALSDLEAMDTWLADLEGLFKAGVKDITFEQSQWEVLTLRSDIRTELFPKVYLDPSNLWVEKQEKLIGTMLTAATYQSLEGKKVATVEENVEENVKYHQYENGLLVKEYLVGETVFYEVVSKVEYKQETVQVEKPKENKGLDIFQTVLDVAGLVPGFGEIADGVNGVIYTARGDKTNAALSFGAMIPFAGWASTGGKFVKKGSEAIVDAQSASKATDNVKGGAKGATLNQDQLKVVEEVETGNITLVTNKQKGNYGEMKMDIHFESQGFTRISNDRVTSLDDKIVKGIDGVYLDLGPPPKYILGEAKYGSSTLSNTKDGRQMSETWIEGRNRLESAVGKDNADDILLEGYDRILVNTREDGSVITKVLDDNGYVIK